MMGRMNMGKQIAMAPAKRMAAGGKTSEGTAKDMREDKQMAKSRGMTMSQWESSAADKKHDAPKKMAKGGKVRGDGVAMRGKTKGKMC